MICTILATFGILTACFYKWRSTVFPKPMHSDEQDDSIWLFDVLNTIGANDVYRKARQQAGIMSEILSSFQDPVTTYYMGSTCDGTDTPGASTDLDFMKCHEKFPVIEDVSNAENHMWSLLIVPELDTPAGYVKLQLIYYGFPLTSAQWGYCCSLNINRTCKIDRMGRVVLCECMLFANPKLFKRPKNKPADIPIGEFSSHQRDTVVSYRGKKWPSLANEWLLRHRSYDWPPQDMIQELKLLDFFVVRKGHPYSSEIDFQWRISFSLQERKLMFNLTDVQHKCYIVLKMFNRDIIKLDCITTYHWKTCLFYVMEENKKTIWKKKRLLSCIQLCIRQMLKWVKIGFCPNYFIPRENLFDGRLNDTGRVISEILLSKMLDLGFDSLLLVKKNNICDYVRSRGSLEYTQRLQANSTKVYKGALFATHFSIIEQALSVYNHEILEKNYSKANETNINFTKSLWDTIKYIQNPCDVNTTEYTTLEIKQSLSFLLPNIYTCLASNVSAMAIQNPNPQIRDFLLFGSFMYFAKDELSGWLKFISVLYAAELYTDCEWYIDTLEIYEEYIKYNVSHCRCRHIKNDKIFSIEDITYASPTNVSTCVSFLPSELHITPDAMKYEMFRNVGISVEEHEKRDYFGSWQYRAVVDSNIYFFLLKYLIKRKLGRVQTYKDAINNMFTLLLGTNLRHPDVAYNVLVWIFCTEFNTPKALLFSTLSWKTMVSTDLCFTIEIDTLRCKQILYNSAKIHALVILYNTWFAKKRSKVHFCFQCIRNSPVKLPTCSKCKISTYCNKKCQKKNWKIHKAACEIVKKYHND